jgi:hypothetical protein
MLKLHDFCNRAPSLKVKRMDLLAILAAAGYR